MSKIYDYIENLCKSHGITITKMCQETGVSRASLTDLKKGRSLYLTPKTIYRISAYFGVDSGEMMTMQGSEFVRPNEKVAETIMDTLLNDVSKLAAQYGEDSPLTKNAMRLEAQKQKVIDKLNCYCRVSYDDTDKIDVCVVALETLIDVMDNYFRLDSDAQQKLVERAEELTVLQKKSKK